MWLTNDHPLRRAAAHVLVDDLEAPELDDAAGHHLFRVLRIADGESVTITDGEGRWRVCRAAGRTLALDGDVNSEPARSQPLTLAFAIPKQERPTWIVQKLTEIGIDRIVLLHADRSVVRWDRARAERQRAKLERVAAEALMQCRRVRLPEIVGPVAADDFITDSAVGEPGGRALANTDAAVAIGPEGGWSDEELQIAGAQVTTGNTVLRVETASVVTASFMVAMADATLRG